LWIGIEVAGREADWEPRRVIDDEGETAFLYAALLDAVM
jgi:hypothetical protein